jgi:cell division protein FtsZ
LKVIGVGGAGGNAVNTMIENGIDGLEFIVANTDIVDLRKSKAKCRIQLGYELTGGKGAGAKPEVGKDAALESEDEIKKILQGTDMLFIAAGLGGGTGTGASPEIARIAREMGILTLGILTSPSSVEGKLRHKNFVEGFKAITNFIDSYIIIPNDKLVSISENLGVFEVYKKADLVIYEAAKAMSDIINKSGYINVDFADVRTVLADKGCALMGTGVAEGENRAIEAAQRAISNPLLEDVNLKGCKSILINVTVGDDMKFSEFEEITHVINNASGEAENTITGLVHDKEMTGKVCVTIFAAGLSNSYAPNKDFSSIKERINTPEDLKQILSKIKKTDSNDLDSLAAKNSSISTIKSVRQEVEVPAFMRRFND